MEVDVAQSRVLFLSQDRRCGVGGWVSMVEPLPRGDPRVPVTKLQDPQGLYRTSPHFFCPLSEVKI